MLILMKYLQNILKGLKISKIFLDLEFYKNKF